MAKNDNLTNTISGDYFEDREDREGIAYAKRNKKVLEQFGPGSAEMAKITGERVKQMQATEKERKEMSKAVAEMKKLNEYRNADLSTKGKLIKADLEELELLKAHVKSKREKKKIDEEINKQQDRLEKLTKAINEADKKRLGFAEKQAKLQEQFKKYKEEVYRLDVARAAGELSDDEYAKARGKIAGDLGISNKTEKVFEKFLGKGGAVVAAISKAASAIAGATDKAVEKAVDAYKVNMAKVDTRLQGLDGRLDYSGKYYDEISKNISDALTISPYIDQRKMLEKVVELTDKGVAFNIEQRAYVATLSEKIATTFDALEPTLRRLVRVQQADMTTSQLGAESALNMMLNSMFQDTSYLTDLHDSVQGAIIDATSQLSMGEATAFDYTVQKWLGSLYALGASDSLINSIAQGINYLGTGNVSAFNGNEGLRNLFAMSANRAGMSFSDILTSGLSAGTTNDLLRAMVMYLQEIAGSGNQVVKSAYGGVMGISSLSDLRAIRNLSAEDITSIYGNTKGYNDLVTIANAGISTVGNRTATSEMFDNAISNALFSWGTALVKDQDAYSTWRVSDMLGKAFGGKGLVGNAVDTITNFVKGAVGGISLFNALKNSTIFTENQLGKLNYDAFSWSPYTSRGDNYLDVVAGIPATGISYSGSASYGNSSGAAAYNLARQANAVTATSQSISGSDWVITRSVGDLYSELFEKQTTPIKVNLVAVGEEAAEKLDGALMGKSGYEQLVSIRTRLDNEFDVDIKDNDVNAITSAINTIRAW